ncbi:hypothetical protein D3C77_115590 [compost metagenome]
MRRCSHLHFLQRPVYVPTVELVVSAHIKHWAAERLICLSHTTRLGADVTGQDDQISIVRRSDER